MSYFKDYNREDRGETFNLKTDLDNFHVVRSGNCRASLVGGRYTFDSPKTGSHSICAATSDWEIVRAHWEGFLDRQAF